MSGYKPVVFEPVVDDDQASVDPLTAIVGVNIKMVRKHRQLTQGELGGLVGCSGSALSMIERGVNSTTIETVHRIAKALDIDVPLLFHNGGYLDITRTSGLSDSDE